MSRHRSPAKVRVSAAIRQALVRRGMKRVDLARAIGVSPTMAGYWLQGRYLPTLNRAAHMADVLDAPLILLTARTASVGSCRVCTRPFARNASRRAYCSVRCRLDYHKGVRAAARPASEQAIEAFCHGCEPEGICRTEECPLRAFSPLLFVAWTAA